MKDLGLLLKNKREEKNVSLDEVAVATKISIKILQALEEGALERLPAKPFIRGFVQSYARYLGLDVKEILVLFQESMGSTNPKMPFTMPQTDNLNKNLPGSGRQIITVVSIVVVIVAIVVIQRVLSKRESDLHNGEMQAITGNDSPLKVSPTLTPAMSASPQPSASASVSPTASGSGSPSPSPSPSPTASATPTPTATPSPMPTPKPTPKPTPTAKPSPVPEVSVPQEIIVEALDRVTVKVTIDSEPAEEVTLSADQIQTFHAKGTLKLYTPNGGALSIIHNGYDMGVPGNLGQPKTMVFPK